MTGWLSIIMKVELMIESISRSTWALLRHILLSKQTASVNSFVLRHFATFSSSFFLLSLPVRSFSGRSLGPAGRRELLLSAPRVCPFPLPFPKPPPMPSSDSASSPLALPDFARLSPVFGDLCRRSPLSLLGDLNSAAAPSAASAAFGTDHVGMLGVQPRNGSCFETQRMVPNLSRQMATGMYVVKQKRWRVDITNRTHNSFLQIPGRVFVDEKGRAIHLAGARFESMVKVFNG